MTIKNDTVPPRVSKSFQAISIQYHTQTVGTMPFLTYDKDCILSLSLMLEIIFNFDITSISLAMNKSECRAKQTHSFQKTHHFAKCEKTLRLFRATIKSQDLLGVLTERATNLDDIFGDVSQHTNSLGQEMLKMSKEDSSFSKTNTFENCNLKLIISVKEARKLLGKKISDQLSDEEVGVLIGNMSFLANRLLETKSVP